MLSADAVLSIDISDRWLLAKKHGVEHDGWQGVGVLTLELLPIALSVDSQADIDRFYQRKGIRNLEVMRDRTSFVFNTLAPTHPRLNAKATPTTILVGADGFARGAYVGVAGWESRDGLALLNYYIDRA